MSSEREMILKMVEEQKISVDDAVKLFDALKGDPSFEKPFVDHKELENKINKFSSSVEGFAREVAVRMSETWRGVEPKVKKATKTALGKTKNAVDKLSKTLSDSMRSLEEDLEDCFDRCADVGNDVDEASEDSVDEKAGDVDLDIDKPHEN